MPTRRALALVALAAAAAASLATDYALPTWQASISGPHVTLESDRPQTFYLDVAFTGDGPANTRVDLNFEAKAGRSLGNPELEVTVTEEATGEEVAFGADRQPFGVSWITPCDEAADCGGTYRIDLALAAGREAEIDWSAGLSYSSMPEDSDAEPLVGTIEISD